MNKSIVVTGASKGIGLATARALAETGWNVIGIARKAPGDFPGVFIEADLSDPDRTETLAKALALKRDLLGIVNNFGRSKHEVMGSVDPAAFTQLMDLNVRPALQLTQALLPVMKDARYGRIINVTSLITRGLGFRASYAAAKAALESLTRTMASELASYEITANAVAPGPTETEVRRSSWMEARALEVYKKVARFAGSSVLDYRFWLGTDAASVVR
jgi:NAD(P)-dependent dehydrogenase (short-subunit alcohol dehydrogenase family)